MIKEYVPKIKKVQRVMQYILIFELIFFTAFVGYQFFGWKRKMNTLNKLTGLVSERSELFTQLGNMEKETEKLAIEIKNEKEKFFKRDEFESFVDGLEERLNSFGLNLKSIYIKDSKDEEYSLISVDLEISGKMDKVKKFISFLENYEHLILVRRANLLLGGEEFNYSLILSLDFPIYKD